MIFFIVFFILDKTDDIKTIETEKMNKSFKENSSKLVTPQKKGSSFCDNKVPESNSVDHIVHVSLNGDDSTEFIPTSRSKSYLLFSIAQGFT